MSALIQGPAWGVSGTSGAVVLNPLRVENSIFAVVDRLLPGVISTTPHARYLGLHGLLRKEAGTRSLESAESTDLIRRCEAVTAAIAIHHDPHLVTLPEAHGESSVKSRLEPDGSINVAKVSAKGEYSKSVTGFYGTYRGPEVVLGIIGPGAAQEPGDRYDDDVVRPALGSILELASRKRVSTDELRDAGHLCPCAAQGDEASWLRDVICGTAGGDNYAVADDARRDTTRIIVRTIGSVGTPVPSLSSAVRHAISYGGPLDQGPYAGIDLAEAWRGLMLRNRSVGAWRNLWWWLVQELTEPQSLAAIADALAAELPEEWVVADLTTKLPPGVAGNDLFPVEEELRAEHPKPTPPYGAAHAGRRRPATRRAKRPGLHGPRRR